MRDDGEKDDDVVSFMAINQGEKRYRPPDESQMVVDTSGAAAAGGSAASAAAGATYVPPQVASGRCGQPCEAKGCPCEGFGSCIGHAGHISKPCRCAPPGGGSRRCRGAGCGAEPSDHCEHRAVDAEHRRQRHGERQEDVR